MVDSRPFATLPLLDGDITLESALDKKSNIIQELTYTKERVEFCWSLWQCRRDLEKLVAFHLNVASSRCGIGDDSAVTPRSWLHGSFNYYIPVYVSDEAGNQVERVLLRFPLPYKLGDSKFPGNCEE